MPWACRLSIPTRRNSVGRGSPTPEDGPTNYCGTVNAKSPYPAYSGWQAYIVEGRISGGKMTSAVVGLIAGGKDVGIVRKMCQKYGLDPGSTT